MFELARPSCARRSSTTCNPLRSLPCSNRRFPKTVRFARGTRTGGVDPRARAALVGHRRIERSPHCSTTRALKPRERLLARGRRRPERPARDPMAGRVVSDTRRPGTVVVRVQRVRRVGPRLSYVDFALAPCRSALAPTGSGDPLQRRMTCPACSEGRGYAPIGSSSGSSAAPCGRGPWPSTILPTSKRRASPLGITSSACNAALWGTTASIRARDL